MDDWKITATPRVGSERTGWRDWQYSAFHHTLCRSLGMCDLDATVWLERDYGRSVAVIETKFESKRVNLDDDNNTALRNLCDAAGVPFFVVRYYPLHKDSYEMSMLVVVPANDGAKEYCTTETIMSPLEYEVFLKNLREENPMSEVYKASRKTVGNNGQTFWNPVGFTVFVGTWEGKPSVTLVDERTGEKYPCFPPKQKTEAPAAPPANDDDQVPF
jgi:hypothetical protein